jgi:ribosomal protein S20
MRQEAESRDRNRAIRSYIRNLRKKTLALIAAEDAKKEEVVQAVNFYKSQLDKTWAKGVFKRNKSSELKSKIDNGFKKRFGEEKKPA